MSFASTKYNNNNTRYYFNGGTSPTMPPTTSPGLRGRVAVVARGNDNNTRSSSFAALCVRVACYAIAAVCIITQLTKLFGAAVFGTNSNSNNCDTPTISSSTVAAADQIASYQEETQRLKFENQWLREQLRQEWSSSTPITADASSNHHHYQATTTSTFTAAITAAAAAIMPNQNADATTNNNHNDQQATPSQSIVTPRKTASNQDNNNRTLVVVLGNLRGGEVSWRSMYRHVLDVNRADLALVLGETPPSQRTSSMYDRAKFVWEFPEYGNDEGWSVAMDAVGTSRDPGLTWRNITPQGEDALKNLSNILGPAVGSGSSAINLYARFLLSQRIQQLRLLERYDRFVVTRSDHYYLCDHPLDELDPAFVWFPRGEDYGGIVDRHVFASNEHVLKVLDMLPPLIVNPKRYLWMATSNPETLLAVTVKEHGLLHLVKRFDRMMFLAATPTDGTRWRKPQWTVINDDGHPLENYGIKYPSEFRRSVRTCNATNFWMEGKNCVTRLCSERTKRITRWCEAPPCQGPKPPRRNKKKDPRRTF